MYIFKFKNTRATWEFPHSMGGTVIKFLRSNYLSAFVRFYIIYSPTIWVSSESLAPIKISPQFVCQIFQRRNNRYTIYEKIARERNITMYKWDESIAFVYL